MELGYATVGSNRLGEAKQFFDLLFESTGIKPLFDHPSGGRVYGKDGQLCFGLLGPLDGRPATIGNGTMVSFRFDSREEASRFHARALALGAKDEGAPGVRGGPYFMSYFRDLDGNKFCAFCEVPDQP